ncbi:MAG: hypothetical protein R3284_07420, partial [Rubricoccaceae bacterium]|nr:hypothetical protein [Rubricoccaceae bacterium]
MSIPTYNARIALADNPAHETTALQRLGLGVFGLGLLGVIVALFSDLATAHPIPMLSLVGFSVVVGPLLYFIEEHRNSQPGIDNDGVMFSSNQARGHIAWIVGIVLTGGYILLYWFPQTLEGLVRIVDPLAYTLAGTAADRWFLYGTIYTVAVVVMGVRALVKYRHSTYQIIRTLSVMFFQLGFAFLLPQLLRLFN